MGDFTDFVASLPTEFSAGAIETAGRIAGECETALAATATSPLHALAKELERRAAPDQETGERTETQQLLFIDALVCQLWLSDLRDAPGSDGAALAPMWVIRNTAFPPPVSVFPAAALSYVARRAQATARFDTRARYHDFVFSHPAIQGTERIAHARGAHAAYLSAGALWTEDDVIAGAAFDYLERALVLSATYNLEREATARVVLAQMRRAIETGFGGFAWQLATANARPLCVARKEALAFMAHVEAHATERAAAGDGDGERSDCEMVKALAAELGDTDAAKKARLQIAQSWETEACGHRDAGDGLRLLVALHEAIRAYGRAGDGPEGGEAIQRLKLPYLEAARLAGGQTSEMATKPITVPEDKIQEWLAGEREWLAQAEHPWLKYSVMRAANWPGLLKARREFEEARAKTPMLWLASRYRIESDGRVLPPPEDEEERERAYLMAHFSENRQIHAFLMMTMALEGLHAASVWTADILIEAIREADEDMATLCAQGIRAFESKDYWTATHLLAPQVERGLREVAFRITANVLRLVVDQGIEMATLGPILSEPAMVDFLGPDLSFSLPVVFCEQRGLNIRNKVAHGLYAPNEDMTVPAYFALMGVLTTALALGFVTGTVKLEP